MANEPLLEDVGLDNDLEEIVSPNEFINEVYKVVLKRHHRTHEGGIYPSDLLYDMVPTLALNGLVIWWMSFDHPIALMLKQNQIAYIKSKSGQHGRVKVYADVHVKECRDCIIKYCREFGLKVNE